MGCPRAWSFWGAGPGRAGCLRACLTPLRGWTDWPPARGCASPLQRPGSEDRSGLQGEGTARKEAEAGGEGGRLLPWKELQGILGSEFSLQGIHVCECVCVVVGGRCLGEVMGKPVSFFCPWCFPASPKTVGGPPAPPELPRLQRTPSSPLPVLPIRRMYRRRRVAPFQEACLPAQQWQISALKGIQLLSWQAARCRGGLRCLHPRIC